MLRVCWFTQVEDRTFVTKVTLRMREDCRGSADAVSFLILEMIDVTIGARFSLVLKELFAA